MSGSQRSSSLYAREALIEIDYSDLPEELKVRWPFKAGPAHPPEAPPTLKSPPTSYRPRPFAFRSSSPPLEPPFGSSHSSFRPRPPFNWLLPLTLSSSQYPFRSLPFHCAPPLPP